jgi:uncharacterized damage-inducible protein DinB
MTTLEGLRRLWDHARWADSLLFEAIPRGGDDAGAAVGGDDLAGDAVRAGVVQAEAPEADAAAAAREFTHVIGAEETWLARLECRAPRAAVWPALSLDEIGRLMTATHGAYAAYLASLREDDLATSVAYTNSAGRAFETAVGDILLHVALHGQYHRGKVNLLLRRAGVEPVPVDFIGFLRGVPAATEATSLGARGRS